MIIMQVDDLNYYELESNMLTRNYLATKSYNIHITWHETGADNK